LHVAAYSDCPTEVLAKLLKCGLAINQSSVVRPSDSLSILIKANDIT
jgi:hypothetical protein